MKMKFVSIPLSYSELLPGDLFTLYTVPNLDDEGRIHHKVMVRSNTTAEHGPFGSRPVFKLTLEAKEPIPPLHE